MGSARTHVLVGTESGLLSATGDAIPALAGRNITAMSVDGDAVWALVEHRELWQGGPEGWTARAALDAPVGRCLLALGDDVLVGCEEARMRRVHDGDVEELDTFAAVPERSTWYQPWGDPPVVRSLAVDPDGVVFANVHVGGIVISRDRGDTWASSALDKETDIHQVVAPRSDLLVSVGGLGGLYVSTDGGGSWSSVTEGMHATYCRAVAVTGDTVFLTASTGPQTHKARVYRWHVGDDAVEQCEGGLPERFPSNVDTGRLAATGPVVALGTSEGELYLSDDRGDHWDRVLADLPPVTAVAIAA